MLSIAIDMDDTMGDTHKKLKEYFFNEFNEDINDELLSDGKTKLQDIVSPEKFKAYRSYLFMPGFFRNIEVFPGAIDVIRDLNKKYDLFFVSSATEFPNSLKDKLEWMNQYFPFTTWQQLCLCGSKSLVQTDYMIDDRSANFEKFKGKPYLYTAYHNLHETKYERLDTWEQVAKVFL